jgi:hypothetical protein
MQVDHAGQDSIARPVEQLGMKWGVLLAGANHADPVSSYQDALPFENGTTFDINQLANANVDQFVRRLFVCMGLARYTR